jgi:hypothetical protein
MKTTLILAVVVLGAAQAAWADDSEPPPPPPKMELAPAPDDASATPPPPAKQEVKLPPLVLPPDTEQADSGDEIGFVSVRFGVVAQGVQDFSWDDAAKAGKFDSYPAIDTRLQVLQLRAFGSLPYLEDSFFLINVRSELSPRITFALFQIPIGYGHYFDVNSGGGSLSNALVISTAKQPLLEPEFWMINAFEQNNGAAAEVHGPLFTPSLRYRVFANGGAGQSTGNIGGQRITFNDTAFTYAVGTQLTWSALGYYDRFDNPFLYKPQPLTLGFNAGWKYEQRAQERFPAMDLQSTWRWGRFEVLVEDYSKAELNFGQMQNAWSVMGGVLIIPEWLFFAVDGGQFATTKFGALTTFTNGAIKTAPPLKVETDLKHEVNETDLRAALHTFVWRNNGILSLRYTLKIADQALQTSGAPATRAQPTTTHDVWLSAMIRF